MTGTPWIVDVLDAFPSWRSIDAARERLRGVESAKVEALVGALVDGGLLERSDASPAARPAAGGWSSWDPVAGLFHGATRDVRFTPPQRADALLSEKARRTPPPEAVTASARGARAFLALPEPTVQGDLADALRTRRTWRRFGARPVTLDALSTLLGLTWGVQGWMDVAPFGRMPLKTSPSGGARHAIEAHVVVSRVTGVPAGVYHYDASAHALVRRGGRVAGRDLRQFVPHQSWVGRASVLVFMTAVFERVQWRYPFPRAYRTVLAEAGHHAQSFCLLATRLGLAPFCTMALADTVVERTLHVDGLREAVMYAVGVGTRPSGVTWAPWPGRRATPPRVDVVPGRATGRTR